MATLLLRNGKMSQIKHRPTQFEQGKPATLPAPYGGLNLRDDITALKPNEARVLENLFPGSGELTMRDGFERHAGDMGSGEVKTLAAFVGLTATKMIACANGKIYDATSATAVSITGATQANPCVITATAHGFTNGQTVYIKDVGGMTQINNLTFTVAGAAANTFQLSGIDSSAYTTYTSGGTAKLEAVELATGLTQDRWQTALYNNRLILVNGTDAPKDYNGSAIASTSWSGSGLTITNLVNVGLSRNRLWFCENNSADVWYASIGAITGALTKFQLSQIAKGGVCMAIGSWSRDSGIGADDVTVFVMSTGEIIIYEGDPASTFNKIGSYWTGAPVTGRQCLFNVGGELVVITRLGLLPVSAAIGGVALDLARIDPWGKIAPGIVRDALLYGGNAGWHGVLHEGVVYVNVPQTAGAISKQRVLNTRNGSWTDFTSWNGSSFASFNNDLYFGAQTGGVVYKVTGNNDNGEDITAIANCAFVVPAGSYLNNLFTLMRPRIQAEGNVSGVLGVDTNYVVKSLVGDASNIVNDPSTTPWGSEWGSPWGSVADATALWYGITGEGRSVAPKLRATGQTSNFKWQSTDLIFKQGGTR